MKEMNVISIVNIRASFPPLNSQGVRPLFNLHLKQIQGNVSQARVPEDFRITFITIFSKASGTPFFLFSSFFFFLLEFIYLIGFEACQKNHKPLSPSQPTTNRSLSRCPYTARLPINLTAQCMHCVRVLTLSHIPWEL